MRAPNLSSVVVTLAAGFVAGAACAPTPGPTAEDGAAHLGLEDGTTFSYRAGESITETHEVKTSGELFAGVAVDVLAKQNGFAEDDRTMTLGVDIQQASILRFFDCNARCGKLSAPIAFLNWPLNTGDIVKGEADVIVTANQVSVQHRERHTTTVGDAVSITVPAGTFDDAFPISWSRTITEGDGSEASTTTLLHWVPDVGVVKQEEPDGTVLELSTKP